MTQISSSYLVLSLEILSSRQALYWLPCVTLHYTNQPIVTGGTRPRLMASLSNNLKMKEFPSVSCFFALGSNSTAFVVLVCWHAHKYVIVLTAWRNPLRLKKNNLKNCLLFEGNFHCMRHRKAFSYPFFRKTSPFVHLSRVLTPSPAFHAAKLKQPSVAELSLVMLSTASMNAFLILLLSCWRRARAYH